MNNFKISVRLGFAFAMVIFFMLITSGVSINRLSLLDSEITQIAQDKYPKVIMLQKVKDHLSVIARGLRNMLLVDNKEDMLKEAKRVIDSRDSIGKIFEELDKVVKSDKGKALLKEVEEKRTAYVKEYMAVLKLIEDSEKEKAAKELLTTVRKVQTPYFEVLDKMIELDIK